MGNLAAIYCQLGQLQDAKELQETVLQKTKQHLGENHPITLISMGNLALTYYQLGQLQDAKELAEEVQQRRAQHMRIGNDPS
jgi:tetratricopeptide (TPR) repeat protein